MRIARTKPRVLRGKKNQRRTVSRDEVTRLFNMAAMRARKAGDPRLDVLLKAKPNEREQVLRAMGILSETDVTREFGP